MRMMLPKYMTMMVLSLASAGAARAVSFHSLDYFLTTTKGLGTASSCTAEDPNNPGTYNRIFAYAAGHCPGVPLYLWTKGAPQWSEEHYFTDGTFIKLLDDTGNDLSHPGELDISHGLLEHPGQPGLNVFVVGTVQDSVYIEHQGYYVSEWVGNTCPSTWRNVQGPFTGADETVWVGNVTSWLYDCRSGRPCTNGQRYPVQVIQRDGGDIVNNGPVDHFWFARWQDPMDGYQWRGLGFIKFWCTGAPVGGWCSPASESHYLVDCSVSPVCYACP